MSWDGHVKIWTVFSETFFVPIWMYVLYCNCWKIQLQYDTAVALAETFMWVLGSFQYNLSSIYAKPTLSIVKQLYLCLTIKSNPSQSSSSV